MKHTLFTIMSTLLLSACITVNSVQEKPIAMERLLAYQYPQLHHVSVDIIYDRTTTLLKKCHAIVMLEHGQSKQVIARIAQEEKATVYLPIGESWLTVLPDTIDPNPVCREVAQSVQLLYLNSTELNNFILIKSNKYKNVYSIETNIQAPKAQPITTTNIPSMCKYEDYYLTDNLEKRACPNKAMTTPNYLSGSVYVRGYYRKDGTYVKPHTRNRARR